MVPISTASFYTREYKLVYCETFIWICWNRSYVSPPDETHFLKKKGFWVHESTYFQRLAGKNSGMIGSINSPIHHAQESHYYDDPLLYPVALSILCTLAGHEQRMNMSLSFQYGTPGVHILITSHPCCTSQTTTTTTNNHIDSCSQGFTKASERYMLIVNRNNFMIKQFNKSMKIKRSE
jgi:hypothetical protein